MIILLWARHNNNCTSFQLLKFLLDYRYNLSSSFIWSQVNQQKDELCINGHMCERLRDPRAFEHDDKINVYTLIEMRRILKLGILCKKV